MRGVEPKLHRGRNLVDVLTARSGGSHETLFELRFVDRNLIVDPYHGSVGCCYQAQRDAAFSTPPPLNSKIRVEGRISHLIRIAQYGGKDHDMITALRVFIPMLGALAMSTAYAHHGWSEYDSEKTLKVAGVIKEAGYEHPHGHIRLATPGKTWLVVLAPPSRMSARGLSASELKPGTQAEAVGYANRTKPDEMRAERIIIGGKTVELR